MTVSPTALFDQVLQGSRSALGKALTLLESENPEDRQLAIQLLEYSQQKTQVLKGIRLAISGPPGVGKSTLIEALGQKAISAGHKVGVITIDPTSRISQGSILGDKSRMTTLSNHPNAFIRSSPAGQLLGGLARRSFELMSLLESAGYNWIFLETVGVGQSEHMAWQFTDGFVLVLHPGLGDELQGIKRGITELADIVLINKADGDTEKMARLSKSQFANAMHYFSHIREGWTPQVLTCSATTGDGIGEVWNALQAYRSHQEPNLEHSRANQRREWISWSVGQTIQQLLLQHPVTSNSLANADENRDKVEWSSIFRTEYEISQMLTELILKNIQPNR